MRSVRVVMGDSALTMDMGGASAAVGVSHGGMVLRRTAAEARRLLIEMASRKLGVSVDQLTVTDGVVHGKAEADKRVTYAELIGGRYFDVVGEVERQDLEPARGRGRRAAENPRSVQGHRPIVPPPRPAGKGVRHAGIRQ